MSREAIRKVPTVALAAAFGCAVFSLSAAPAHAAQTARTSPATAQAAAFFPPPHQGPPGWHQGRWWAAANLTITVQFGPGPRFQSWRLTCDPDGGTLPNPVQACWRLNQAWGSYPPLSHDNMCTTMYFGPQTVTITGWWHGSWVSVRYNRANGCQETMWNQMVWALGLPNGQVNPGGPMQGPPPPPGGHWH
jgi:hypothetical protein